MIVELNDATYENWYILTKLLGGFKASYDFPYFSLDEKVPNGNLSNIGDFNRCNNIYQASEVIEIIGADAFKNMIENIWKPEYMSSELDTSHDKLWNILSNAFVWRSTPQGFTYWEAIYIKFKNEDM